MSLRTLVIATLVLSVPAPVWAQQTEDELAAEAAKKAKLHYQRGTEAYSVGRYLDAIRELEEAYRLSGESVLLFNIAKSYEKLEEFPQAIRHLRDYLDLTPLLSDEDRASVETTIKSLEEKRIAALPELTIRTTPEGAKVALDEQDNIVGETPYKARIEPGQHKVYLEKEGYLSIDRPFKMPKDEPVVLDFEMKPVIEYGDIQVVADVDGARLFVDGKNVGITPYREKIRVKVGKHQVYLEKPKFHRYLVVVEIPKDRTVLVNANMKPIEPPSTWPSTVGWISLSLGAVTLGAAYTAALWANGEVPWQERPLFNDSQDYRLLADGEFWGYVGGGVLFAAGLGLLIWDGVREDPGAQEEQPPPPPLPLPEESPDGTSSSTALPDYSVRSLAPVWITF